MQNTASLDVFGLMMNADQTSEEKIEIKKAIDEAFIDNLNNNAVFIDVAKIAGCAGVPVEEAISSLRGTIYQDPAYFTNKDYYDVTSGWVISQRYLSGILRAKLKIAMEMNERFPGKFDSNIEAIRNIIPEGVGIEDIYIRLGAPWIPAFEYENFFREKIGLEVEISYYKDGKTYRVKGDKKAKESTKNIIGYGVAEDRNVPLTKTSKASSLKDLKVYFTAIELYEDTLNGIVAKANDYTYIPDGNGKTKAIKRLNKNKTVEAQNLQNEMHNMFCQWIREDEDRAMRFEEYYNTSLVGYAYTKYDGSFLTLPELNPDVVLYKYQRDIIARVLLSETNVLIAHDVGAGKSATRS